MDLVLLQTLVAVIEAGGFTAAAERLCVTQSAVSRRIRQLEEHYGITLLERGAENVLPTPAGSNLVERARDILELARQTEQEVSAHKRRERIAICCTPGFGTVRLPEVLERFGDLLGSKLDLNIVFKMPEDALEGLATRRYDLAVIEHCEDLDLTAHESWTLLPDLMVFISAPSLGLVQGSVTLDDLTGQRLFLKTRNGCAHRFLRSRLRGMGRKLDEFPVASYYDDLGGVVRQVLAGHGIGFVSRELASRELDSGVLLEHRIAGFNHERCRTLLLAGGLRLTESVRRLVAAIFESMSITVPLGFGGPGDGSGSSVSAIGARQEDV